MTASGFDIVDLAPLDGIQDACAAVRAAGEITDDQAGTIRRGLDGAVLRCASGTEVTVLHIADEGLIMRSSGPNRLAVVGPRSHGMNDHGAATSVHADQDVFGTPLSQLMGGRAPELFRHDSPDGRNDAADLMLVNLWIPLQQITQPLVLSDGGGLDRRQHQLRYGLATDAFLERDDDTRINDIWTFLHDESQRWYLRSEMDHRQAYLFNTLSTPHGAGVLPGEELAERCYRLLERAEEAVESADSDALAQLVSPRAELDEAEDVPRALRSAIAEMIDVLDAVPASPTAVVDPAASVWVRRSRAARRAVVRMSIELRLVVSVNT